MPRVAKASNPADYAATIGKTPDVAMPAIRRDWQLAHTEARMWN